MSHTDKGLLRSPLDTFATEIRIENFGRTPAEVTDVVLDYIVLPNETPLPIVPKYKRPPEQQPLHALLVAGENFTLYPEFMVEKTDKAAVMDSGKTLYFLGYVDYIDKFGQRRRGGYARKYIQTSASNNLVFVTQRDYNYDRKRERGQGHDWDKETPS
jgi:hypothetical protein